MKSFTIVLQATRWPFENLNSCTKHCFIFETIGGGNQGSYENFDHKCN
uniref:Uncharacterized protein n=1 Tax=Setaria italica TaxID=4555 RepID=K3XUK2_SETIT